MADTSLFVDLGPGERLHVDGPAVIDCIHKSGRLVRLRVQAAPDVRVERKPAAEISRHASTGFVPRLTK